MQQKNKIVPKINVAMLIVQVYLLIQLILAYLENGIFTWLHPKHILGIIGLLCLAYLFFKNHKSAILLLGLYLFFGAIGLLSLIFKIEIRTFFIGKSDFNIPIFYGQPIYWLMLVILIITNFATFQIFYDKIFKNNSKK